MTSDHTLNRSLLRYQNPVFRRSFPDPFVIKHNGEYFAYCTGHWEDGRVFGVLRSRDLVSWEPIGGAMEPVDVDSPFYWAPEVTYANGVFYLYYSLGNETLMHLRVATSERPDGGFRDVGIQLTREEFAIDAHVFRDDDGQRYMFYATDFLEHTHIGTGVVVDKMLDWHTLAGNPRPVVRARYDWQVYDPARKEKGGVRWHTVEGPYVLKRKGEYFVMFSGGNWQNISYGVSFAKTNDLSVETEWEQFCDGAETLPILRTYPDKLIGPGHNSVVRGPNNRELYCVYHCWEGGERVLAINRMDIVGERMMIEDEPFTEKPVPYASSPEYSFAGERWVLRGEWDRGNDSFASVNDEPAALHLDPLPPAFLCEVSFRMGDAADGGKFGIGLTDAETLLGELRLSLSGWSWVEVGKEQPVPVSELPKQDAVNLLRIEADHCLLRVSINENDLKIVRRMERPATGLTLFSEGSKAIWSGFQLTEGFESRFDAEEIASLEDAGWTAEPGISVAVGENGSIRLSAGSEEPAVLRKGVAYADFEFAANLSVPDRMGDQAEFGFLLFDSAGGAVLKLSVVEADGGFAVVEEGLGLSLPMPDSYHPADIHQFRITKTANELRLDVDTRNIGVFEVPDIELHVGVQCRGVGVTLETVRATRLHPVRKISSSSNTEPA